MHGGLGHFTGRGGGGGMGVGKRGPRVIAHLVKAGEPKETIMRVMPPKAPRRWWKRFGVASIAALALMGCASDKPAPALITPDAKLIYADQSGHRVWTYCTLHDRVFMNETGSFQIVANGCPDGRP